MNGAGIVTQGELRNLVGRLQLRGADLVQRDFETRDVDAVGREAVIVDQANAGALDAGNLDLRLRLLAGSDRDILDRQRARPKFEPDLAMARLAAACA
ncbi:hypothetical protein ABH975_004634 [Bradyrhizobium ottawaense]|uniref:hypothetical protein n=1 Tax=Bradyrhizobium ottawaense TaxID=931866 RepID=UPI0035112775